MKPPLGWPFFVCVGVIGGAVGTVALSLLIAAMQADRTLHRR